MILAYYDIFVFLLLLAVGALVKNDKKAMLGLLGLSFLLIAISAYFFYSENVYLENVITYTSDISKLKTVRRHEEPVGLLVSYFFVIWSTYFCLSFLFSRGLRAICCSYLREGK